MGLKIERIKNNLTQQQLADLANCSRGTIGHIEAGKIEKVQFGTLKKIAVALNSSFEELFLSE